LEVTERSPETQRNSCARSSRSPIQQPPPRRFIAGADAIATAEQKIADLRTQIEANRASRHR